MKHLVLFISALMLGACQSEEPAAEIADAAADVSMSEKPAAAMPVSIESILAAQPDEAKARYVYRNPKETLEFFGVEPGMTVVEALPGGGWYTKMLLPYLGENGCLIGVNYSRDLWSLFDFATDEMLANVAAWQKDWVADAEEWRGDAGASVEAFHFGSMTDDYAGKADVVLFVRALHNLAAYESQGDFLTAALGESFRALKPGGILGIVQHEARDNMSDSFADGSNGYLKKAFVIAAVEQAGFDFVAESNINENAADQPSATDIVWRLPPSFMTSRDDVAAQAAFAEIGESNRMTLKFRKPE